MAQGYTRYVTILMHMTSLPSIGAVLSLGSSSRYVPRGRGGRTKPPVCPSVILKMCQKCCYFCLYLCLCQVELVRQGGPEARGAVAEETVHQVFGLVGCQLREGGYKCECVYVCVCACMCV